MKISDTLKTLRREKGLTQKKLAELSGVSENAIKQYESNKRTPRIEQLKLLADALEVGLSKLLIPISGNKEIDSETYTEIMQFNRSNFMSSPVHEKPSSIKASQLEEVIKDVPLKGQTDIWMQFNEVNMDIDLKNNAIKGLSCICKYLEIDISKYTNENILELIESATFKALLQSMLQDLSK